MVLMPPARLLRSATKALRNSIANTAVSSASRPCGTFGQFFPQMFRDSNRSVVSDSSPSSIAQACALRLIELAHTSCGVLSEWSATLPQLFPNPIMEELPVHQTSTVADNCETRAQSGIYNRVRWGRNGSFLWT